VIFGGFSSEAIKDRVNDCEASVIITADGGWRRGKVINLKANVDRALTGKTAVKHVVVVNRTGTKVTMKKGRDLWWGDLMAKASIRHTAKAFDSETPLFILYTSGSTGKPKGVLHTTGGYLLGTTMTSKYVFDLKESDTYWCTADIGWITGHSYVVYGILSCGATSLVYEGAPNHPEPDRFWSRDMATGERRCWSLSNPNPEPLEVIPFPPEAEKRRYLVGGIEGTWRIRRRCGNTAPWLWDLNLLPEARPLELRANRDWTTTCLDVHPAGEYHLSG